MDFGENLRSLVFGPAVVFSPAPSLGERAWNGLCQLILVLVSIIVEVKRALWHQPQAAAWNAELEMPGPLGTLPAESRQAAGAAPAEHPGSKPPPACPGARKSQNLRHLWMLPNERVCFKSKGLMRMIHQQPVVGPEEN